jgi:hypothetical protein
VVVNDPLASSSRRAAIAFGLAVLGPFVMAASSPAAIVLGWRSSRDLAIAPPAARGRAAAAGAIALGTFGLLLWAWALWRLWVRLDERGDDPHAVVPLVAGLIVVWLASALAGALAGRNR